MTKLDVRLRIDVEPPTLITWSEPFDRQTGKFWTEYDLAGNKLGEGIGEPPGNLGHGPIREWTAQALWAAIDERDQTERKLRTAEQNTNRLSNELAHAKAIANGVQNALRDQLGEARHDRDAMTDARLADHREFWRESVTMRTEAEYTRDLNAKKNAEIGELKQTRDNVRTALGDAARALGIDADAALYAPVDRVAQMVTERLVTALEVVDDEAADRIAELQRVVDVITAPMGTADPDTDLIVECATEAVNAVGQLDAAIRARNEADAKIVELERAIAGLAKHAGVDITAPDLDLVTLIVRTENAIDGRDTRSTDDRDRERLERRVDQLQQANATLQGLVDGRTTGKAADALARLRYALDEQQFVAIVKGSARETIEYQIGSGISVHNSVDIRNANAILQLMQGCANGEYRALVDAFLPDDVPADSLPEYQQQVDAADAEQMRRTADYVNRAPNVTYQTVVGDDVREHTEQAPIPVDDEHPDFDPEVPAYGAPAKAADDPAFTTHDHLPRAKCTVTPVFADGGVIAFCAEQVTVDAQTFTCTRAMGHTGDHRDDDNAIEFTNTDDEGTDQ